MESYSSEWPVGLLLDEVWLRTRRDLVRALEEGGLWPAAREHDTFLVAERTRGESLRDDVLLSALAEDDRRWLVSPAIFGASNRRFRMKTPMALSFGYGLSEGMQSVGGGRVDVTISQTCGIFNFGISIFDLLHDAQPRLISAFSSRFDRDVLIRLHSDASSPRELKEAARTCEEPEIRLLLQTIAAVYGRLYALASHASNGAFARTTSLLAAAYAAEMQSAASATAPLTQRLEVSRAKSTLPFAIMDAIGAFHSQRDECDVAKRSDLSEAIGTIFWLTDDLVDVVGDARSGALNSLLARVAGEAPLDVGSTLSRLLDGQLIPETAQAIRDALLRVRAIVRDGEPSAPIPFDQILASYVRTWIE